MSDDTKQEENKLHRVYGVVAQIPAGKISSYGAVARMAGLGKGARYVGYALRKLPKDTKLPWHRVVNSQGHISLPDDSPGYAVQIDRLKNEGVLVRNKKIHLKTFFWES